MIRLKDLLTEIPRLIPNLPSADDFGLRNINKARYSEFLSLPKEEYFKYDLNRIVYSSRNITTKELVPIVNMLNFEEIKQKYKIWGTDKSHQKQLIVISNKNLEDNV